MGLNMTRSSALRLLAGFLSLLLIPIIIYSCKPDSSITSTGSGSGSGSGGGSTGKTSTISGQVVNSTSGIPMDSVLVHITGSTFNISLLTDSQGKYTGDFTLTSNVNFTIIATKTNFVGDTTSVTLIPGGNVSASVLSMTPSGGGSKPSGNPVSIFLLSQSASSIGVKETGSVEIANLVFQVVDSSGTAIDLSHSVNVKFVIAASPGGGEVISPSLVQTNDLGQATVNITSGTKAGVVQIIAEIDLATNILKSKPVLITINAGLPDLNHFTIYPDLVNFPIQHDPTTGFIPIYALVGDKYSNPTRPNTSIYFETTGGVITTKTAQTDEDGIAQVKLIWGNPFPDDAILGKGFARVTATTVDENSQQISRQAIVLFSALPQISISPGSVNIPNGGSQGFTYTVADENGNPMAGGTKISVAVEGENIGAQGDLSVLLPDTQDKLNWTNFSFTVYDAVDTLDVPKPVTITITSDGPNGKISSVIKGTGH